MKPKGVSRAAVETCAREGLTINETASLLGLNKMTVWRRGRRAGLTFKRGVLGRVSRSHRPSIVAAILDGVNTSPDLAVRLGMPRPQMSVHLWQLARKGVIEKAGYAVRAKHGRTPIAWRVTATVELAQRAGQ
jgi:hypothetical protein